MSCRWKCVSMKGRSAIRNSFLLRMCGNGVCDRHAFRRGFLADPIVPDHGNSGRRHALSYLFRDFGRCSLQIISFPSLTAPPIHFKLEAPYFDKAWLGSSASPDLLYLVETFVPQGPPSLSDKHRFDACSPGSTAILGKTRKKCRVSRYFRPMGAVLIPCCKRAAARRRRPAP